MSGSEAARRFGRYEVVRPLGRGAVGEVFLARDPALGREVAVKVLAGLAALPPDEAEEARQRFLREARAAAALQHPNLVTVHDVGEADGQPFMAMEVLRGTTLDRHVRAPHLLPLPKVLDLGVQAAAALDVAHRGGIIHRDIKPANLVMLADGSLKVSDFGLAKGPETALTAADTVLGTPNYMAPEQIAGRALDGRTDLFALAVSLFELLAGQRPFGGDSVSSVLYRIVNDPATPLRSVVPDAPADLEAFFEQALAKDPAQRVPDAATFAARLAEILAAMGGLPRTLRLPPPAAAGDPGGIRSGAQATQKDVRPAAGRRWLWVALGVAIVAAAVAIGTAPRWMPAEDREVELASDPPGLAITLETGTATAVGPNRFRVAGRAEGTLVFSAADECRSGRLELEARTLPSRATIVAVPRGLALPVASDPAGATVRVNGEARPGTTPLTIELPACRAAAIELTLAGRPPVEIQLGAADGAARWKEQLAAVRLAAAPAPLPTTGRLVVQAPPGYSAEVRDRRGKPLGEAGATLELPAGRQTLVVANPDLLLELEFSVDVPRGGERRVDVPWPALGAVTVRSVPPEAVVSVRRATGGAARRLGATPLNRVALLAGDYELTVSHPLGARTIVRPLAVAAQGEAIVRIGLEDWR